MTEETDGRVPIVNGSIIVAEAKWSEEAITIGLVNGKPFTMHRPLNQMAMKQLDVGMATALALHDRVQELETRLKSLEDRAIIRWGSL
jgi:hypothetical protein